MRRWFVFCYSSSLACFLPKKPWERASQVDELAKNPPEMQESLVRFLGMGSSPNEGLGYPLQYSWASLVVQMVKNWPAMWETWVRSLGWEDPCRRKWQPNPVSLLENPHGHRSLTVPVFFLNSSFYQLVKKARMCLFPLPPIPLVLFLNKSLLSLDHSCPST